MRIVVYGAGVIGSFYAALLSKAGFDVSVYARGRRLKDLRAGGLTYKDKDGVHKAEVTVIDRLDAGDRYDFVFLTVREDQIHTALTELRDNVSPTIVTMANSLEPYDVWETLCGQGRILPAFPGAGGGFDGSVLDAALTPRLVQPTTFGRLGGRERDLAAIFKKAGVPYQIVGDMHTWQICHLAMVVPIADAYYEADDPEHAGNDSVLMRRTARRIKENFQSLRHCGIKLLPGKMHVFLLLPTPLIAFVLGYVYRSRFGDRFMYRHSLKAPEEMHRLHEQFYQYLEGLKDKT
ncbi:MAG: ketopantoate reductase family protein [Oscillospiraceae bacterium]|nr:ketopantoate reductase family protein [Oscillospiraceae bacterium]